MRVREPGSRRSRTGCSTWRCMPAFLRVWRPATGRRCESSNVRLTCVWGCAGGGTGLGARVSGRQSGESPRMIRTYGRRCARVGRSMAMRQTDGHRRAPLEGGGCSERRPAWLGGQPVGGVQHGRQPSSQFSSTPACAVCSTTRSARSRPGRRSCDGRVPRQLQLRDQRVVVADVGAPLQQLGDDLQRRRLADVLDVGLVGDADAPGSGRPRQPCRARRAARRQRSHDPARACGDRRPSPARSAVRDCCLARSCQSR